VRESREKSNLIIRVMKALLIYISNDSFMKFFVALSITEKISRSISRQKITIRKLVGTRLFHNTGQERIKYFTWYENVYFEML